MVLVKLDSSLWIQKVTYYIVVSGRTSVDV